MCPFSKISHLIKNICFRFHAASFRAAPYCSKNVESAEYAGLEAGFVSRKVNSSEFSAVTTYSWESKAKIKTIVFRQSNDLSERLTQLRRAKPLPKVVVSSIFAVDECWFLTRQWTSNEIYFQKQLSGLGFGETSKFWGSNPSKPTKTLLSQRHFLWRFRE